MRKIFSSLMIAVFAVGMMVSGSFAASTIDIAPEAIPFVYDVDVAGATSASVQVDRLWVTNGILDNVDFGDSSVWPNTLAIGNERGVGYYCDVALNDSTTLLFDLTDCAIKADNTLFLLGYDTTLAAEETLGTLNDFGVDANGNYTWIRIEIDTSTITGVETFADNAGVALAVAAAQIIPAQAVLVLSKEDHVVGYDGIEIVVDQNASTGTIAVTEAKNSAGNDLAAPLAGAETIITVINGVSAKIVYDTSGVQTDGPATSIIDVDAATPASPRTAFVDENIAGVVPFDGTIISNSEDTDLLISEAGLVVGNTAEFGLTLNAGDMLTLTVKRAHSAGVTGIQYSGVALTAGTNEWAGTFAFGGANAPADGTADAISITVNGTTILKRDMWTATLTIDPDQDANEPRDLGVMTLLTDANSHDWDINGAQFVAPNMLDQTGNFSSWVIFKTPVGASDALIFVDMVRKDGAVVSLDTNDWADLTLPAAAAGGYRAISAQKLLQAAGWTTDDAASDFYALFTVTLPQSQVFAEGYKVVVVNGEAKWGILRVYDKKSFGTVAGGTEFVH